MIFLEEILDIVLESWVIVYRIPRWWLGVVVLYKRRLWWGTVTFSTNLKGGETFHWFQNGCGRCYFQFQNGLGKDCSDQYKISWHVQVNSLIWLLLKNHILQYSTMDIELQTVPPYLDLDFNTTVKHNE